MILELPLRIHVLAASQCVLLADTEVFSSASE
jgi:hypothetical protein